jgi:hypothetical protein
MADLETIAPKDWLPDRFETLFGYGSPIGNVYRSKDGGYKTLQGKPCIPYRNCLFGDNNQDRVAILALLRSSPQKWTATEIAKAINIPRLRVSNGVQRLLGRYLISKENSGSNTVYFSTKINKQTNN